MDMASQDIIYLKNIDISVKSCHIEIEGNRVNLYIEEQKEEGVGNNENLTHTITFEMAVSNVQNFRKILEESLQYTKQPFVDLISQLINENSEYTEIRNEGLTTVCIRRGMLRYETYLDKLIRQQSVTACFFNNNPIEII